MRLGLDEQRAEVVRSVEDTISGKPGRKEIERWIDRWLAQYVGDPFVVTPEQLYMLFGSNIGWDWDIDDVGKAISYEGTQYEWVSPLAGLYKFLGETMVAKKKARGRTFKTVLKAARRP